MQTVTRSFAEVFGQGKLIFYCEGQHSDRFFNQSDYLFWNSILSTCNQLMVTKFRHLD